MSANETGPQHQLPSYRPKGMSKGDKIMAWTLATIVIIFVLGTVANYMNKQPSTSFTNNPHPTATATAKARAAKPDPNATTIKLTPKDKWFIDAYATLHKVSEQVALTQLIESGIKQQSS